MESRDFVLGTLVAAISVFGASPSPAAQRMVGVVPSDGQIALVKRFDVPAGASILGVRFENNDASTVFPEVLLIRGPLDALSQGVIVAATANVMEAAPGIVTVMWPGRIMASGKDTYYVAVRMPSPAKMGPGLGTAIGAADVAEPNGSFLTCGEEQSLLPARVDLAMTLLLGVAKLANEGSGGQPDPTRSSTIPRTFLWSGNPNPANPSTSLRFGLAEEAEVFLSIYDVSGRRVRILIQEVLPAGLHERVWDGHDDRGIQAPTGVYVVRLVAGTKLLTQKLVIAK